MCQDSESRNSPNRYSEGQPAQKAKRPAPTARFNPATTQAFRHVIFASRDIKAEGVVGRMPLCYFTAMNPRQAAARAKKLKAKK
jgi:hypothetical protein